jgi:hypothetical protein
MVQNNRSPQVRALGLFRVCGRELPNGVSRVGRRLSRERRGSQALANTTAPSASSQQRPSHWPLISSQRRRVAQTMPTTPGASHEQPTLSLKP